MYAVVVAVAVAVAVVEQLDSAGVVTLVAVAEPWPPGQ
jgi:hypothetical protein